MQYSNKELRFNYNWNGKLSFSNYFTTIRIHNAEKYSPGNTLEVYEGAKLKGNAQVIDRKTFYLKDLNHFMACLDTGYTLVEAKDIIRKMYNKVKPSPDQIRYDFVLLKWIKEEIRKEPELFNNETSN